MEIPGESRKGDYICYFSNLAKLTSHYPNGKSQSASTRFFATLLPTMRSAAVPCKNTGEEQDRAAEIRFYKY